MLRACFTACVYQAIHPNLYGSKDDQDESSWDLEALALEFFWVDHLTPPDVNVFTMQDMLALLRGPNLTWC